MFLLNNVSITESAPLQYNLIKSPSFIITVSLFLSELNSINCNLSKSFSSFPSPNLILFIDD